MAARRYWRILCNASTGAPCYSIGEWHAIAVAGGPNILVGGLAFTDASYNPSYVAANAFDDNPATSWASPDKAAGHYVAYDLGAGNASDIYSFSIQARSDDNGSAYAQTPTDFDLQYSDDGIAWTTRGNFTAGVGSWFAGVIQNWSLGPSAGLRASQLGLVAVMSPPVAEGIRASQLAVISVIANGQSFQPLGPVVGLGCWSPCNNHMYNGE